jgi:flagellar protein FliJ
MSTFHFQLATLLRLRETARDERRGELAETRRADTELQRQLTRLMQEQERLQHDYRTAAGPGAVDVSRLIEAQQYALTLRAQQAELERQRQALATEIDRRRQALIEADRELRTLERLRQRQWEIHQQEDDRQDGKRLDEAALQTAVSDK